MKYILAIAMVIAAALVVGSCALWEQKPNAEKVPGTDCYYSEVNCGKGVGCCPQSHDCGGVVPSCQAGWCCFNGEGPAGRLWSGPAKTPMRVPGRQ